MLQKLYIKKEKSPKKSGKNSKLA